MKVREIVDALRAGARRHRQFYAYLAGPENVKTVAYELARLRCEQRGTTAEGRGTTRPDIELPSLVCSSLDWHTPWLPYWAARCGMKPAMHRKLWEFAYIAQALSGSGLLRPGARGLGFGCGKEPLASLFVAEGCEILATDLAPADATAKGWSGGEQHAASLQSVWMPNLCSRAEADARLTFRAVDMNAIPADLDGAFDFCWSSCALEHLGSIDHGLAFIERSSRCLRPGGIGVHTTEFKADPGETLEHGPTVLFQERHFARLATRLADKGLEMRPIVPRAGDPFLDGYVDVPPYPTPSEVGTTLSVLHLRLLIAAHRSTSIGVIVRATHA
jgi:SAM-dependent methyltransferase